ncbi:tetratricopeptide repeat protein [Ferviditalea candida]|uniref:Tetratricopeptide repeat protein n=1 Tax=Ferviditalea candida TaxID=3108399 RepID=A0ABU5ZEG4_9BACL|nr:tetratricopeptide repeat protein [Paenibacillaceae bacterium T2]
MGKFMIFSLLWWITGNPLLALLVLLIIVYVLDRRFVGVFPDISRPFKLNRRLAKLLQELRVHSHNTSGKLEAARILIEKKRFGEAKAYLEQIVPVMEDSAEVLYELGLCHLKLGELEVGEKLMQKALSINPRVKYGEPYLRLGEAFLKADPGKALHYLENFRKEQSSSCQAYYLLGKLYNELGRKEDANRAFREISEIYRVLPKYKRKQERRWVLLSRFRF